ncbi:hypothetical protein ACHAXT_012725 [Thalassiosira profunda]
MPRSTLAKVLLAAAALPAARSFRPAARPSARRRPSHLSSTQQSAEAAWKPAISSLSDRKSYFRSQALESSETLGTMGFHHVEFWVGDALTTAKRFELALGVPITCWSSLATGNDVCVTYGLECGVNYDDDAGEPGEGVRFLITAPLSRAVQGASSASAEKGSAGSNVQMTAPLPLPGYDIAAAHEFYSKHGLAVRAVGVEVADAEAAFDAAVGNGAIGVLEPTVVENFNAGGGGDCKMAEVKLYGDVVLRLISFVGSESGASDEAAESNQPAPFLPNLSPYPSYKATKPTYGLARLDHSVGNVPDLLATQQYIQSFTGYHPFAEFTPEDIGTVDSGLNSVVLASDNENVLLPLNEPTEGKRKSQIQTYLEQNEGPGLQHIAIKTNDIFETIAKMRRAEEDFGGFELMVRPSDGYYRELPSRLGDKLTDEQYERLEELGILADADEEGVLLQIFTKPLGDRPTLFLEIIQRIGCIIEEEDLDTMSKEQVDALLAAAALPAARSFRPAARPSARRRPSSHLSSTQQSAEAAWKPAISSLSDRKSYFRNAALESSETLGTLGFHHVEFWAGDALTTAKRFELALGVPITCWSSLATGNDVCVTYGLECGVNYDDDAREPGEGVRFLITAPLSRAMQGAASSSGGGNKGNAPGSKVQMTAPLPLPGYDIAAAHEFYSKHGLAVRAVGVEVVDAEAAFDAAVGNGAIGVLKPTVVENFNAGGGGDCKVAEVKLYGDVVLRLISFAGSVSGASDEGAESNQPAPFLPNLSPYPSYKATKPTYGLARLDHTVGNVPDLLATQQYIQSFTGYHPFAEFTPEDIGTVDSGLNSVVLASDNENVLLPLNEPTEGKRKSQIQTYLEQNEGPGLQHIAIKTNDIFETIAKMRRAEEDFGGFELMVRPSDGYYRELPSRLGDKLTDEQYERLEELGILADADEEGVLLQIFTKPLGDRPTLFLEIIQRIGCVIEDDDLESSGEEVEGGEKRVRERPGCGGFGQGNFRELFKAIEDHEKTLKV